MNNEYVVDETLNTCINLKEDNLEITGTLVLKDCNNYQDITTLEGIDDVGFINVINVEGNKEIDTSYLSDDITITGQGDATMSYIYILIIVLVVGFLGLRSIRKADDVAPRK